MKDYLYDKTFEGLLTCIYYHYYEEEASGIYIKEEYQASMLYGSQTIKTDEEKADKVYSAIREKISAFDLRRVYKVFKSNALDKEKKILDYIVLGFKIGSKVGNFHRLDIVHKVQEAENKVNMERHRLCGLVRFSAVSHKILYSAVEPDNDVLEFLAEHFADRYRNETFIIHDTKREKALMSDNGQWYISDFQTSQAPQVTEDEFFYEDLWKNYFTTIAIKERKNPRCQKNFMPVRYWKNLTEMK